MCRMILIIFDPSLLLIPPIIYYSRILAEFLEVLSEWKRKYFKNRINIRNRNIINRKIEINNKIE